MNGYSVVRFIRDCEAEQRDAVAFVLASHGERIREHDPVDAYGAGFAAGARAAHRLLVLHAGLRLSDGGAK